MSAGGWRSNVDVSFFFRAGDGIRDRNVTGVQTCALPISNEIGHPSLLVFFFFFFVDCLILGEQGRMANLIRTTHWILRFAYRRCETRFSFFNLIPTRSEERRVGKECRYWWVSHNER